MQISDATSDYVSYNLTKALQDFVAARDAVSLTGSLDPVATPITMCTQCGGSVLCSVKDVVVVGIDIMLLSQNKCKFLG